MPASKSFTVVAEDCWAGMLYRFLYRPYMTPFAGTWIDPTTYLDFLETLHLQPQYELEFYRDDRFAYPTAFFGPARVGFMHAETRMIAQQSWTRRMARCKLAQSHVKIDFRKEGFGEHDIKRWNKLKLPRSVAFIDQAIADEFPVVHNKLIVDCDTEFFVTLKKSLSTFCWWRWLKSNGGPTHLTAVDLYLNRWLLEELQRITG